MLFRVLQDSRVFPSDLSHHHFLSVLDDNAVDIVDFCGLSGEVVGCGGNGALGNEAFLNTGYIVVIAAEAETFHACCVVEFKILEELISLKELISSEELASMVSKPLWFLK